MEMLKFEMKKKRQDEIKIEKKGEKQGETGKC